MDGSQHRLVPAGGGVRQAVPAPELLSGDKTAGFGSGLRSSLASRPPVGLPKKTKVFLQELPREVTHSAAPTWNEGGSRGSQPRVCESGEVGFSPALPPLARGKGNQGSGPRGLPRARSPHHPSPPQGGSTEHPALAALLGFPLGLPGAFPASPGWVGLGPEEKARPSREGPRAEELRL